MGTDLLYYIMDCSGNYYKLGQGDQLVVATDQQDAEAFTFAQANGRVNVGKKAAFYCMVPIEDKTVSTVKELTYDEVTDEIEKNASSYDLSEMDWGEYLTHFIYLVSGIKNYRDNLAKKHSDIDQKICDILHYIELCETNDDEAIDLIELLRVCRENRREIKDELQRIEYFQVNLGTNANATKAKQALKAIKGLETRKYKPRKYDELFENCVLKDKRLQRDDIYEAEVNKPNFERRVNAGRTEDEGREEIMNVEERNYTPYDGKENDWLSFARQQAEFYRNAGQYITNLKLDIAEIDKEIEDILLETEAANCNVAQGYKVFKRLKELRLERKSKTGELDCLYALTDYIDCDSLADTCEANLEEVKSIVGISEADDKQDVKQQVESSMQEEIHVVENIEDMVG